MEPMKNISAKKKIWGSDRLFWRRPDRSEV